MRVYLARHGAASVKEVGGERPLTDNGQAGVKKVAAFIEDLDLRPQEVRHSEKLRAAQTAEILAAALAEDVAVSARKGLAPDDPVGPVRDELDAADGDIMLVGHLPFMAKLASALLTGKELSAMLSFQAGAIACLEKWEDRWQLLWLVSPGMLR